MRGLRRTWWMPNFTVGIGYDSSKEDDTSTTLPHRHGEYAVKVCLSGRMDFVIGDERQILEAGELIVHNPGQIHQSYYAADHQPCDGIDIHFDAATLAEIFRRISHPFQSRSETPYFLGKARDEKLVALAQEMVEELRRKELGFEALLNSLVVQFLVYLLRQCVEPTLVDPPDIGRQLPVYEMGQAMRYIETRRKCDFQLGELCMMLGTSQSRFEILFRNSTFFSPHQYSDRVLIRKAQELLLQEECSIKQVAYELGFQDCSYFSRVFRQVLGTTPDGYRREERPQLPAQHGTPASRAAAATAGAGIAASKRTLPD